LSESELGPLPGGHHGLTREQIVDSQRERLLASIADLVAKKGYRGVTITEVVKRASVSTRDFYELFTGKEDCFLSAFEVVRDHLEDQVRRTAPDEPDWAHRVIAGLRAVLDFFAAEPGLARFCLVDAVSATPTIAIRFREAVLMAAPGLAEGREELDDPDSLLPETEDAILGGIVSLTTRSIVSGEPKDLSSLLPDLAEFTLGPYLGAERAAEIAHEVRNA
jgi:AcrR family transcriptional regulator